MQIQMQVCLPRDSRYVPILRNATSQFLADLGVSEDDVGDVELALTEACANVVRHAVDTTEYVVEVEVSDAECVIVVCDEGPGFDPQQLPVRAPDARPVPEQGRGLELINALVDDVRFDRDRHQHSVLLRKTWGDPIEEPAE